MKNTTLRLLSILLFSLGILAGMALFVTATWADVESVFYGFNRYGNKLTSSMHCPYLLDRDEIGTIEMVYRNTSDQSIRPTIRFQTSRPGAFRTETERLALEAGESATLVWEISREDTVLNRFIFAKVFSFASYPLKDVEQTCGILVLDLPGVTGGQATIILVVICLGGIASGIALWYAAHKPMKVRALDVLRAMYTLGGTVILGLVSMVFGWWLPGILFGVLALILVGVIVGNLFTVEKV